MRVSELNALPWEEVESTNIARLAFSPTNGQVGDLFVHFFADGEQSIYRYSDVPEPVFRSLRGAASVGGMHAKIIKGKYRYERLSIELDPALEDGEITDDPLVVAIDRLADRIQALEAEVANLVRLIVGKARPQPPRRTHDRDEPARSHPE